MDDDFKERDMFAIEGCGHKFCKECMSNYVLNKVESNQVGPQQVTSCKS